MKLRENTQNLRRVVDVLYLLVIIGFGLSILGALTAFEGMTFKLISVATLVLQFAASWIIWRFVQMVIDVYEWFVAVEKNGNLNGKPNQ